MEMTEQEKLFLENVFTFVANKEKIYADERMFLTPVPVINGLAYVGSGGFRNPCLGVYLRWWDECPEASVLGENGTAWLVWSIAGSPLSGRNSCAIVNGAGQVKMYSAPSFGPLWHKFIEINRQYADVPRNNAYSLEKTVNLLKDGLRIVEDRLNARIFCLEKAVEIRDNCIKNLESRLNASWERTMWAFFLLKKDSIVPLYEEYLRIREEKETEARRLREKRRGLKARLRQGDISNVEYQQTLTPLKKKIHLDETRPYRDFCDRIHWIVDNDSDLCLTIAEHGLLTGYIPEFYERLKNIECKKMTAALAHKIFLFIENKERIYSDGRLFYVHLPDGFGGMKQFSSLGSYLRWLDAMPEASFCDDDGTRWAVWYLAGNPMTGTNTCSAVNAKGETKDVHCRHFMALLSCCEMPEDAARPQRPDDSEIFSIDEAAARLLCNRMI